ncbi:MAG: polysaccharide deacetylase family protein [Oscillospiraceae bacterium]|nr:polysaccharide deacetylase family protein [Oscillospiraceae bacterium]
MLRKFVSFILLLCILLSFVIPAYAAPNESIITPNTIVANRRDSTVYINNQRFNFHTFDINGQNHMRIRDLAFMLNRTGVQFGVSWNSERRAIQLTTGTPYTPVGSELRPKSTTGKTGIFSEARVCIDGTISIFNTLSIDGETYFRLRDISTALGFSITWSASDSRIIIDAGSRTVEVSVSTSTGPGAHRRIIDTSRPVIALTFDDGPGLHTTEVLDILSAHGTPATFFVLGRLAERNPATITRMYNFGHEIANHSWSHALLTRENNARITKEIVNTNMVIESITGRAPVLFRAPYGAVNSRVEQVLRDLDFPIINWSLDSRDWENRNANAIYNATMRDVRDRDILLYHDIHITTAHALRRIIPSLIAQGFQLVTVSELMCFSGISLQAGQEYRHGR